MLKLLGASVALVGAWLLVGARARAEIPPEWFESPVVAVEIEGDATGAAEAQALVPAGAPLRRTLLRTLTERLLAEGSWADVQVGGRRDARGVTLIVKVVPRLLVRRVDVVGNRVLGNAEIERLVALREDAELDPESFEGVRSALRAAYATRGYYAASAQILVRDTDDPQRKVVRVEVVEGEPTRIASVRFRGEPLPRRRGVRRLLGVGIGDPADLVTIGEGLERTELLLRQNGYYAAELGGITLEPRGRRARVFIESTIGPRFEVRFVGHGPISPSELLAALHLEQERFSGEATLRAVEQKLGELYRRYSFPQVTVRAAVREERRRLPAPDPDEHWEEHVMIVEITIETGAQREVEKIVFPGASHYEAEFLREQIYSYLEQELPGSALRQPVDSELADQLGFGGAQQQRTRDLPVPLLLNPRRFYHAPTYLRAVEHIRELYRSDGFLDVEVADPTLTKVGDPDRQVAVIAVHEGPRTFLHAAEVEGNRTLSSRELLKAARLRRDRPFSYFRLEEARLRMVTACQEQGYYFADVRADVRRSGDGTRAEVTFHVDEGYPVRVAGLEVRGAERSSKAMILNRSRLRAGDLYRPSYARETQDALLALDVFSSVSVAPDEPSLRARAKTVVITVTERKTQWLGWSAGFSTGEGVRGGLEYGYRNLFGSAVQAAFRGQLGYQFVFLDQQMKRRYESLSQDERAEYQVTLSLGVPYVPHLPKLAVNVDVSAITDIQRDFRMQKEGAVVSLLYRPIKTLTLTAAEELEFSDFRLFRPELDQGAASDDGPDRDNIGNLTVADLVPEGENTLLSTQLSGAWDRRDRSFNPHGGFLFSATAEWARTLSNEKLSLEEWATTLESDQSSDGSGPGTVTFHSNMLRFTASFSFYIPLGPRVTFASQTRWGRVVHLDRDSESYPNRRFYLGGTNFRGYYQNQMVPQDLEESDSYDEARGVISRGADTFLVSQNELRFPLYGDLHGGLFTDLGNLWAHPRALDVRQLEPVVGLGLRFHTPVASLAFDYGVRAIQTQPFRLQGAFQFAFQTF